jgi:hypothetical protein
VRTAFLPPWILLTSAGRELAFLFRVSSLPIRTARIVGMVWRKSLLLFECAEGEARRTRGAPSGGFHARIEFPEALYRRSSSSGTCEAGDEPADS